MANIKFTYAAVTLLSLTTVANSISASNTFTNLTYAAAPARSISFTTEIVPTRSLADDSVSVTDSSFVLEITKVPGDSITVSDTPVMAVDIVRTDSVNVTDTPNKIINSSIDFDLSDSDVDPDPISISDAPAMTVTPAGKTDSVTASDSPFIVPNKGFSNSITMADSFGPFTIGLNPTDSVSITEIINEANTGNNKTSSVSASDVPAMTVTPAGKTDSVTASDSPVLQPDRISTDSITMADSFGPFTIGLNPTDTVSAVESIATTLTLGDTTRLYPTRISAFDGAETGKVRGFHIGNSNEVSRVADLSFLLNEGFSAVNEKFLGGASDTVRHYNRVFNQDLFRLRVLDFSGQISNDDSLLNSTVILDDTSDSDGVQEFTGLIGGDGYIGQPIVNSDTITYGELTNAGLLVNFIYTDTSDSPTTGSHAVNGHFFNETPMGAGSH